MTGIRWHALVVAPLLVLGLGITGCGGDGGSGVATANRSGAAATADEAQQAKKYTDCLRDAGVTMTEGADGALVVDKEKTPEKTVVAAAEKCRTLQPAADATGAPSYSTEDLDKRRKYASCIRTHGVKEYPDPDPQTGESELSDELARKLKTDDTFQAATEACRDVLPSPSDSGVRGG